MHANAIELPLRNELCKLGMAVARQQLDTVHCVWTGIANFCPS
jgi:hypothetical protein